MTHRCQRQQHRSTISISVSLIAVIVSAAACLGGCYHEISLGQTIDAGTDAALDASSDAASDAFIDSGE